jgi:cobalamin biosynthesis protein CobT
MEFGKKLDTQKRKNMEQMVREVHPETAVGNPRYNDDGWAVGEASKVLSKQKESQKILIVLSDGVPEPSATHKGVEFELGSVVENIEKTGKHEIIGLGLGSSTGHVEKYYSKNISNIPVHELPSRLAKLLKDIVEK